MICGPSKVATAATASKAPSASRKARELRQAGGGGAGGWLSSKVGGMGKPCSSTRLAGEFMAALQEMPRDRKAPTYKVSRAAGLNNVSCHCLLASSGTNLQVISPGRAA